MKTIYTILLTIAFFAITPLLNAQNFYLHPNGVTCMCPNAAVGDTGVVNGITYTKRTREQITPQNAATTCTSGITDMSDLFNGPGSLNGYISSWDTSNVTDMSNMFTFALSFNQPLNNWNVSNVTKMTRMFSNAQSFNQPLNNWDVSNVTDMRLMFQNTNSFNQPLNDWDVSNVTDMSHMFSSAILFNQPLNNWDVSNVTNMFGMFMGADSFNQPLNNWDVSNVTDMNRMFFYAFSFDQPLNNWDVSNVTDMEWIFYDATSFNQDISSWCVDHIPSEPQGFAVGSPLQQSYKPLWGEECNLSITTVSNQQIDIKFYPNPTRDVFILDNKSEHSIETTTILNMQGQVVKQVGATQANAQEINIRDLASGNYFIQIETNKANLVKRLIKN